MSTSLASIKAEMKKELENLGGSVAPPTGSKISLDGKVFTLPDGTSNQGPLSAIILDHRVYNTYYEGAYNKNDIKPPVCFTISKTIEGVTPSKNAPKPQGENCKDCEKNQWGTNPAGGKGKACKNQIRLAVVQPGADPATAEPMTLIVSPTGLSSFGNFIRELQSMGKLPTEVIANISFNAQTTYPQLVFSIGAAHNEIQNMWELRKKAQAVLDAEPV